MVAIDDDDFETEFSDLLQSEPIQELSSLSLEN